MAIYKPGSAAPTTGRRIDGVTYIPRVNIWQPPPGWPVQSTPRMQTWGSPLTHPSERFKLLNAIARQIDQRWSELSAGGHAAWQAQAALYAGAPTPICVPHRKLAECDWWYDLIPPGPAYAWGQTYHRGAQITRWEMGLSYDPTPPAPTLQTTDSLLLANAGPPPSLTWLYTPWPVATAIALHVWAKADARAPSDWGPSSQAEYISQVRNPRRYSWVGGYHAQNGIACDLGQNWAHWRALHPGHWVSVAVAIGTKTDAPMTSQKVCFTL